MSVTVRVVTGTLLTPAVSPPSSVVVSVVFTVAWHFAPVRTVAVAVHDAAAVTEHVTSPEFGVLPLQGIIEFDAPVHSEEFAVPDGNVKLFMLRVHRSGLGVAG